VPCRVVRRRPPAARANRVLAPSLLLWQRGVERRCGLVRHTPARVRAARGARGFGCARASLPPPRVVRRARRGKGRSAHAARRAPPRARRAGRHHHQWSTARYRGGDGGAAAEAAAVPALTCRC
jgi:hypothetical protein